MATNTKPTPKAVQQALELWSRLEEPTPRERAESRFLTARRAFHEATEAITHQELGAVLRADQALIELNQARDALAALDAAILRSLLTWT